MGNDILIAKAVASDEFEKVFDRERQILINQCVNTAYDMVTKYSLQAPEWITSGRGKRIIPELKNSAVEFCIIQACKRNILPFEVSFENNARKTGKYLKLKYKEASLTVNQTRSVKVSSRDAKFRKELLRTFTTCLNLFNIDENMIPSKYYFEINHGYQSKTPIFTVAGIPDGNHGWIFSKKLNMLTALSKGESDDLKTVSKDIESFGPDEFRKYLNDVKDE